MKLYLGVDVSKARLDLAWQGHSKTFDNTHSGVELLIKDLHQLHKDQRLALIVCEASGGYEQKLITACHANGLPIHVAHANKIRSFARSKGIRAKTDQIDARILSEYARVMEIEADEQYLSENAEKIRRILKRREQLVSDRKREKNRFDKIEDDEIQRSIESHIEWLDAQIDQLDAQLSKLSDCSDIKCQHDLLTSVPCIGNLTANYLIAYLPKLGKLSHKSIAALVGVAPFNRDSGSVRGQRYIQGGRSALRQVLYMSAMGSIRWNADMKMFYERLRQAGKPPRVALIAVLRKILTVLNSVITRQTPWRENITDFA